jgi:hypothetical protein
MRTTNKILLITFIFIMAALASLLILARVNVKLGPAIAGSGNVITESRVIDYFNAIDVSGGLKVELMQSDEIGLTIEADDNLIELIITEVSDEVLNIRLKNRIGKRKALDVKVALATLEALTISAGANVKSVNTLTGLALQYAISSGAISDLSLDFEKISIVASSGATSKLAGKVRELLIKSSSGANTDARELIAEKVEVRTSSGAINHIFVNNEMSIDASSGGIVNYYGNPVVRNQKTSSGGTIIAQ